MLKRKFILTVFAVLFGFAWLGCAGNPERIGHVTFLPRRSNPDDSGLYNAFIDPTNGYAYFLGNYLTKVDITVDPPRPVGTALNTGSSSYVAIDSAAGYAYIVRPPLINRYLLGLGTNSVTAAGSLTLSNSTAPGSIIVDDSDPDPSKHNAYVFGFVSGNPAQVAKVALSTFTEIGYMSLNSAETNLGSSLVDAAKGYIYFSTRPGGITNTEIVKIKMMPGTNLPVRLASVTLGTATEGIGFGSLDSIHGYAYYGTYGSTNMPSRIYKVKLGDGDAAPTLVGSIDLPQGRAQLSLSVIDPVNGFVYFANDNTYPGGVHQFSLNGSNLPVEISYLQFQSGPSNNPPDASTVNNTTTNLDGILPYGEVFLRSAVFDPVRGYAYFGQDSKSNQFVKVKLAQIDPITLTNANVLPGGSFQFEFTNIAGGSFFTLASTNLTLPSSNWTVLGTVTEASPGQFQFTDPSATNDIQRFYRVRSQ